MEQRRPSLEVKDGWLRYLAKAGKINQHQMDWPLYNGFAPETKGIPEDQWGTPLANGKYYVEFTLRRGAAGTGNLNLYFSDYNNSMKGGSLNLIKVVISGSKLSFEATTPTSTDIKAQTVSSGSKVDLSGDGCKFCFLFDVSDDRVALEQLWLNGTTTALSKAIELNASGKGLNKLMFCPGEGKAYPAGTEILAMDNYSVFSSQLAVLEQKANEAGAKLEFDDIKGANTDAIAIESNLDFSKTETANSLKIMGWKTSNAEVITADGAVTRPQENDVEVVLTPVLGIPDSMDETEGDWLTIDGTPISVTVKSIQGGAVEISTAFTYIQNETFNTPLTNANTQPIPRNENWGQGKASITYTDGDMNIVHDSGKLDYQIHFPFQPGKASGAGSPQAAPVKESDLYMDIKWTAPAEADVASNRLTMFICGTGSTTKVFGCNLYNDGTLEMRESNMNQKIQGVKFGEENRLTLNFKNKNGTTTLEGLWLNDQKAELEKKNIVDIGNGFNRVIFWPSPKENSIVADKGLTVVKVHEVKVWKAFEAQLTELANKREEEITFDAIANENTGADNVRTNLDLTNELISPGSSFTVNGWTSSDENIIAADGTVTRPSYEEGDKQVTLTPVITAPDPEKVGARDMVEALGKPITVTVKATTVDEQLDYLANNLSFAEICGSNTSADAVEHELDLVSNISGVNLEWELVSIAPTGTNAALDMKTGVLQRPLNEESDVVMTVRAKLSAEGKTAVSKTIPFTVKKLSVPTEQYLKEISKALTFAVISGDNTSADEVKLPLHLPTVFNGAKISWSSNNAAVQGDGTVKRPAFTEADAKVTLTAKLAYGHTTIEKTFALTVPASADNLLKIAALLTSTGIDTAAEAAV